MLHIVLISVSLTAYLRLTDKYGHKNLSKTRETLQEVNINPIKSKIRLLHLKTQLVTRSTLFISVIKPIILCYMGQKLLFVLRKYKTHKYNVKPVDARSQYALKG